MFAGEETARASATRVDLVCDQHPSALIAELAQRGEKALGRNAFASPPLNRFDEYCADACRGLDCRAFYIREIAITCEAGAFGQQCGEGFAEISSPGGIECPEAQTVVRALERDDARVSGRQECRSQRGLDRVGSRGGQRSHGGFAVGEALDQFLEEFDLDGRRMNVPHAVE